MSKVIITRKPSVKKAGKIFKSFKYDIPEGWSRHRFDDFLADNKATVSAFKKSKLKHIVLSV
jgi:hypothetical protein